jgi:hypothetical protein
MLMELEINSLALFNGTRLNIFFQNLRQVRKEEFCVGFCPFWGIETMIRMLNMDQRDVVILFLSTKIFPATSIPPLANSVSSSLLCIDSGY